MASNVENFMDMSLDEYIATRKNNLHSIDKKSTRAGINTSNNFEAESRNSKISNDANDYGEVMSKNFQSVTDEKAPVSSSGKLNKTFGIWRGPSCETNYIDLDYMKDEFDEMFNDPELQLSSEVNKKVQIVKNPNDLRELLQNSKIIDRSTIKGGEQCYHTDNERNGIQKTTQSNSTTEIRQSAMSFLGGSGQFRRRWYKNQNAGRRNKDGCGNRRNNYMNNESQNKIWSKNRNGGSGSGVYNGNILPINHNGRIHRFNQRNNEDNLNKRIKNVLEQINSNNSVYLNKQVGPVRDLTIECPSITGRLTTGVVQTTPQQVLKPPVNEAQIDIKALLGVNDNNLKADTMAMWAGKLLELFQSGQQQIAHKPIYDMQIQKEIHELQGKSLLYKCPSGEVVSSDGSGIENCKVTPNSSGVTLNYRFG